MTNKGLILYSTQGCHLCEQADALLKQCLSTEANLSYIDIAYDDDLVARYGVLIPVLACQNHELNWPFTEHTLKNWLTEHGINHD
jgi:hypothetical protein